MIRLTGFDIVYEYRVYLLHLRECTLYTSLQNDTNNCCCLFHYLFMIRLTGFDVRIWVNEGSVAQSIIRIQLLAANATNGM